MLGISFLATDLGLHVAHHKSATALHKALERSEAGLAQDNDEKSDVDSKSVKKELRHREGPVKSAKSGASSAP